MRKKVFSILLSLAMVMAMIPAMAVTTFATSAPEIVTSAPESDFKFNAVTGTITGYHGAGGDIEIISNLR